MKRSYFLSCIPFIFFFLGYVFISFFFHEKSVVVPSLLGTSLLHAVRTATQEGFYIKILSEKEVTDTLPGTILEQKPIPGSIIKPRQVVFIIIAQEPETGVAPDVTGRYYADVRNDYTSQNHIEFQSYQCMHNAPVGMIIAQSPEAGARTDNQTIDVFVSSGSETKRIMPNVCGYTPDDIKKKLEDYGIMVTIYREPYNKKKHKNTTCNTVIQQMPVAGSWIDLKRPLNVRIAVVDDPIV